MRMSGGTCPTPEESQFYDGHYQTVLDSMHSTRLLIKPKTAQKMVFANLVPLMLLFLKQTEKDTFAL